MEREKRIKSNSAYFKYTLIIILLSTVFRGFLAATTEFGNDEVYYVLYAMFPALSHFDHPPMTGIFIQLFSLDLLLRSEFFIRLGAIVSSALSTLIIYFIGKNAHNERAGYFAALLYTASVYASVIAGTFILPDAPQMIFWMLSLLFLQKSILRDPKEKVTTTYMLAAGITIGLGMLSKYTSAFLWAGAFLYILFYNRKWFTSWALWVAGIFTILIFLPVVFWNINNDFISFTFQGSRAVFSGIRPDFLATEIAGEFIYNNPVVFLLILITIIELIRGKRFCKIQDQRFLLLMSIPMIAVFWGISLSRRTLPHWTGPAFFSLIILTALRLEQRHKENGKSSFIPGGIKTGIAVLAIGLMLAWAQIQTGFIPLQQNGIPDPTLDMYGWEQQGKKFRTIHHKAVAEGLIAIDAPIIDRRWFPAANYEYYVAHPAHITVMGFNKPGQIHKYAWINARRGGFKKHMDAWAFDSFRDPQHPETRYKPFFKSVNCYDTIFVERNNRITDTVCVYICNDLQKIPDWNMTIEGN